MAGRAPDSIAAEADNMAGLKSARLVRQARDLRAAIVYLIAHVISSEF